jgi:DnaJ-class molecular chaperone
MPELICFKCSGDGHILVKGTKGIFSKPCPDCAGTGIKEIEVEVLIAKPSRAKRS